jgi:fructose-1,6-bisphosphatase/inositol monophosphatase family enzyme/GNAT superfamily N-acetyltransferase
MQYAPNPSSPKAPFQPVDSETTCRHTRDMVSQHALLSPAIEIVRTAGSMLRGAWGSEQHVEHKGPGDLVSAIDRELDSFLTTALCRLTPEARIVSEESWDGTPLDARMTWVVDPLDGSTAFLRTKDPSHPSVMVALVEEGEVTCTVVFFPLIQELYSAARGEGAFRNGERVDWKAAPAPLSWLRLNNYGDASLESAFMQSLRERARQPGGIDLVTTDPPSAGLACRLHPGMALVHDNNPLALKQGCWDIAAPLLWVKEAGGVFCTPAGSPVSLHEQGPLIIAPSQECAARIIELGSRAPNVLPFRIRASREGSRIVKFILEHGKSEWNHLPENELMAHGREIEQGLAHALVAEVHGEIVGALTYTLGKCYEDIDPPEAPEQKRAYISEVTVASSHRGQGIGSRLLKAAVKYLNTAGVERIYAKRHEQNAGSAGMMRNAGFVPLCTFSDPEIRTTGSRKTTVERHLLRRNL